jgi:hypothetical protein
VRAFADGEGGRAGPQAAAAADELAAQRSGEARLRRAAQDLANQRDRAVASVRA